VSTVAKTATAHKKWLPKHGKWVHFTHRDTMRRKAPMAKATLPAHLRAAAVPVTTLPVDCTGNAGVSCPMLGNDQYGDCGPVMMAHMSEIRTYGQGSPGFTEIVVNQAALVAQYEKVSGGDNGTDEDMLVGTGGIATAAGGGVAGDPTDVVVDHLDVDVTDVALTQYCHDQFYGVHMAWSVPDAFLNGFAQGTVWADAMTPDPNNGHFTPLSDVAGQSVVDAVSIDGFYRLWTWGAWCWVSPAFVASVDPQSFITFSPLQFNKETGYDSHGRHVSDQAAAWVALGGNASLVNPVVAQFPPKVAPTPAPSPTPPVPAPVPTAPPTLAEAQAAIVAAAGGFTLIPTATATAALAPLYPPASP
jgi:hypothetical protein